jgi:hypothetical protein
MLASDVLDRGPFTGSSVMLRIRDGQVAQAYTDFETERFSGLMWDPFERWVSTTYPEDAAVMYADDGHSAVNVTEESAALWAIHVPDYVNAVMTGDAQ